MHLASEGASVSVICPTPSRPIGADYARLRGHHAPVGRSVDGVNVVWVPSFTAPESRLIPRMRESWSFGRHVCRYVARQPDRPDVVYMNAWPLFGQVLIARFCRARNIPLVMQVMDIYPEALTGKLPPPLRGPVHAPLLWLDRWVAGQANRIVGISSSMIAHYERTRHLPPGKATLIHTWVDERSYAQMPDRMQSAARYNVPHDRFTFVFLGNIGPVAGVELLIEAFQQAGLPHAQLLIVGDGSSKANCVRLAGQLGATDRVRFISDPDVANVPQLLSMGDVCLLPMRMGAGTSSLPSKLMAYLLARRPVLASVDADSDAARCIREAECGWILPPDDVAGLAAGMRAVAERDLGTLTQRGLSGARYGAIHFSKATTLPRISSILAQAARQGA